MRSRCDTVGWWTYEAFTFFSATVFCVMVAFGKVPGLVVESDNVIWAFLIAAHLFVALTHGALSRAAFILKAESDKPDAADLREI